MTHSYHLKGTIQTCLITHSIAMASKKELSPAFQKGLDVRGEVLGEQYVTKAIEMLDDEYWAPVQEWITEAGWGAVWTRPGLERKQRSLLSKWQHLEPHQC